MPEKKDIQAGLSGTITATLDVNGAPYVAPAGSTYVPSYAWTTSDPTTTLTPSADTLSVVVNIPGGDPSTSVTITATATAPDDTTISGTLSVPVTPEPQVFSIVLNQTS